MNIKIIDMEIIDDNIILTLIMIFFLYNYKNLLLQFYNKNIQMKKLLLNKYKNEKLIKQM